MTDIAIRVQDLGKSYQLYDAPMDRLKQFILPRIGRSLGRASSNYYRDFWALRDVSFQIQRGDVIGIIGRNGAGKSTLLQIIAGTLTPTSGTVEVRGRVAAMLELGSGFNPEFTGRENAVINASLLGLSTDQINARISEIEAFADIGKFIDQAVKIYSSGMIMRLAFAVQTVFEPEILIIDEALSVGDARFQKKCFEWLERFRDNGGTVLFVTHDSSTVVRFCNRAIVLENGRALVDGDPRHAIREYHQILYGSKSTNIISAAGSTLMAAEDGKPITQTTENTEQPAKKSTVPMAQISVTQNEVRYGSLDVEILSAAIRNSSGANTPILEINQNYEFYFTLRFNKSIPEPVAYGFIISNSRGLEIYGTKSGLMDQFLPASPSGTLYECSLRATVLLVPGSYFLTVALANAINVSDQFFDCRFDALEFRVIGTPNCFLTGVVDLNGIIEHRLVHITAN